MVYTHCLNIIIYLYRTTDNNSRSGITSSNERVHLFFNIPIRIVKLKKCLNSQEMASIMIHTIKTVNIIPDR